MLAIEGLASGYTRVLCEDRLKNLCYDVHVRSEVPIVMCDGLQLGLLPHPLCHPAWVSIASVNKGLSTILVDGWNAYFLNPAPWREEGNP